MPLSDTITAQWAWIIPALSVSAFFVTAVFGRFLPKQGVYIPLAAIAAGFVLFWFVLTDVVANGSREVAVNWIVLGDTRISWGIIADRLSVTMLGLITFVALLVQVYSIEYMKGEGRIGWYYAVHALFAGAMLALVLADNLIFLYLAWELVGLGSYLLIGFWWERRSAAEAAKKAFITTRIGDVGLLIGIILLYRATGTFDISTIFHVAEQGDIDGGTLTLSMLLIFLGAMGKSAQFPFHVWLPDAMEGPTPVSALIHAATMVAAGVFLVARLLPLFELAENVLLVVSIVGLFTFIYAGTLSLVMEDFKQVLAYSTISHLGLMMLALGAGALGAAMLHLVAHGLAKALLFLGAGSVNHATHRTGIWELGGLIKKMPVTGVTFLIGAASLAGIPPLVGFWSKDEVLVAVSDARGPIFLALALGGALLSALYMARVAFVVFFGKPRGEANAHESPSLLTAPLLLLALGTILACVLVFDWSGSYDGFGAFLLADQGFLHHEEKFHIVPWLAGLSVLLAISGVAVGWLVYVRESVSHESLAQKLASRPSRDGQEVLRRRRLPVDGRPSRARVRRGCGGVRPDRRQRYRSGRSGAAGAILGISRPAGPDWAAVQLRSRNGGGNTGACGPVVDADGVSQLEAYSCLTAPSVQKDADFLEHFADDTPRCVTFEMCVSRPPV